MISSTCVDSILGFLTKDQHFGLIHELEFLKLYLLCLAKWNDSSFGRDKNFGFLEESHIEATLEEAERKIKDCAFEGCEAVASKLLEKIEQCRPKIKEDCLNFLDRSFQCHFSIDELPEFMRSVSASLHNLLDLKVDMLLDVKVRVESLEDNLDLFKELLEFVAKRCCSHEDLKDFKIHLQAWACRAACLSLLYWVLDEKKENMATRMDVVLFDLQKKISPSTPGVTRMYLAVLKASKPSAEDSLTATKLVLKFVEFLKDNLQVDTEEDNIQMLFIELIFLMTFLMDRPEAEKSAEGDLISAQADAVVNEAAYLIILLCCEEIKEGSIAEERNFLLHDFLEKANAIKAEVRKIFAHLFLDPSSFNFPRINVLGFIDSLLENLNMFCFSFPKYQILMLREELLSLKQSNLKDFSVLESQHKHEHIRDLWTRIVNLAYNAERAVSSFIYMKKTLWHDILCLSDIIEEVKLIKGEVRRIQEKHMDDIHAFNSETIYSPSLPRQANIPTVDNVFVGFRDEQLQILDRLLSGSMELSIISIVGMGGLGKTTLAKKVYNDASVRHHFHKCAWCTVSQVFNCKRMFLDIVSQVAFGSDNHSNMEEEDLAEMVYKILKGRRYLIVLDDIWSVAAWDELRHSFPDDYNGSRIIFTSRIHNLVFEARFHSSPFLLRPLSKDESWELLQKKLFGKEKCPPDFVEIGKQIASSCKGLPLSIVLTAGLLKENIKNFGWWKEVAETLLPPLTARVDLWDIFEMTYRHLPEFLKPCFLYMGSFAEDEEIKVNKLILLWISEGFIPKHEIKSLEVLAEEYLMDLVGRSLVIVTKRRSTGGIKTCIVHDLVREFCIAKGEEENVFKVIAGREDSYMAAAHAHYRVCIETECWRSFLEHDPPTSWVHSLNSVHPLSFRSVSEPDFIQYITLSDFKFLRILDLDRNLAFDEFPEGITELVLLRYLAIICGSQNIPPSIKRLKNLETLFLHHKEWTSFDLPLSIWEMQKLRHVDLKSLRIPPDFCDDIPALENVQTFSYLYLFYGAAERFLRIIPKVRKLKCSLQLSGSDKGRHQIVKLDFLSHLESLTLCRESIHIKSRGCVFYFPSTLKKLTLINFRLPWIEISPIAKLPNLEVLKLSDAFRGKTWNVGDDEFLKLKFLRLRNLDIQEWNASDESFCCLERLEVDYCRKLEEIPSRFESIFTLKMIQVVNCRSTLNESVWKIKEEQLGFDNEDMKVLIS